MENEKYISLGYIVVNLKSWREKNEQTTKKFKTN